MSGFLAPLVLFLGVLAGCAKQRDPEATADLDLVARQQMAPSARPIGPKIFVYSDPNGRLLKEEVRDPASVRRVVLHDTEEIDLAHTFEKLYEHGYAYHLVIDTQGRIWQFVDPGEKTAHASGANDDSIGIAFVAGNPADYAKRLREHEPGLPGGKIAPANRKQRVACVELLRMLRNRFPNLAIVEGHHDVEVRLWKLKAPGHSPLRKTDPYHVDIQSLAKQAGF